MKWINFLVFLLFSSYLVAQNSEEIKPLTIEQRAEQAAKNMSPLLNLNESQLAAVTKIQLKFFNNLDKAKGDFTKKTPKEQNSAIKKMQSLNADKEKAIMKILDADQKVIFQNKIATNKSVKKEVLPPKNKEQQGGNYK